MKTKFLAFFTAISCITTGCSDPAVDTDEETNTVSEAAIMVPPSPVAVWTFDSCANNVVPNKLGSWGSANLSNGATCGPGAFNNAGIFDGIDDRAEIADDSRFHFTTAMTISLWAKPTNTTTPQTILGKWYSPDSYLLWLSNGSYRFSVALDDGTYVNVALPATPNEYSKIIAKFNGQTITLNVTTTSGSQEVSAPAQGSLRQSNRPITMGNHPSWNPFGGEIDEVQLYNTTNLDASGYDMCYTLGCNPPSSCCPP